MLKPQDAEADGKATEEADVPPEREIIGAPPPIEDLSRGLKRLTGIAEALRKELTELRAALARAEERAEEAEAETAQLEKRAKEAETLADRLEETLRAREEEIEEERADYESQLSDAQRERDEALVLVTSLSRRLGTPGIENTKSERKRPAKK
jgi:chromosome segregation ATPase